MTHANSNQYNIETTKPLSRFEQTIAEFKEDSNVRVLAKVGSFDTPTAWSGSIPSLLIFEKERDQHLYELQHDLNLLYLPFKQLEEWQDWNIAQQPATPLGILATGRIIYDPTNKLQTVQDMLAQLSQEQLQKYRQELLAFAEKRLQKAIRAHTGPGHGAQDQLFALITARDIAVTQLYPALLTYLHLWPLHEIRLPYSWRATVGLYYPKAIYQLEHLYGFGNQAEARHVLLATRGLDMVEEERRARNAHQAGYFDGAVRYLRDVTAQKHYNDLKRWTHISSGRREKLSVLLGITRSPLGPAALEAVQELIKNVREGE